MTTPNVVWYVAPDGTCMVFMHAGDIVRTASAPNVDQAQRTIVSVAIDAFGMDQASASQLAEKSNADRLSAIDIPKILSDHVTLLQEQMADHDRQLTEATAATMKVKSDLSLAQSENAELKKELTAAKAALELPPPPPAPIPVPAPAGVLMPAAEARPHDPNGPNVPDTAAASVLATVDPHNPPATTDTGSGAIHAASGGTQGTTNG